MENITLIDNNQNLFPISNNDFLLYFLVFIIGILSSMAGIGGGGVLTPLFYLLGNYSLHYAIPLSIISIMGNSLVRFFILLKQKHRLNDNLPLIDYGILIQMIPFDSAGSYLGLCFKRYYRRKYTKIYYNWFLQYNYVKNFS